MQPGGAGAGAGGVEGAVLRSSSLSLKLLTNPVRPPPLTPLQPALMGLSDSECQSDNVTGAETRRAHLTLTL